MTLRNVLLGIAAWVSMVVGCRPCAAGQEQPALTVLVRDYARLSASVLQEVENETRTALSRAGIELKWIVCQGAQITPGADACDSNGVLLLRILDRYPKDWKRRGDPLGCAEIDSSYASVYAGEIDRISTAYNVSFSALLAYAAVHEIGHLLLGREHDSGTIMRAWWDRSAYQAIAQRSLGFDARQRAAMHRFASRIAEPRD